MSTKTINTRIGLKYDLYANWVAVEESFVPNKGEVIFYEIPATTGAVAQEPAILFKVGDENTTLKNLPWGSAIAADVYAWAKQQSLLGGTYSEGVWSFNTTETTPQAIKDTRDEVAAFIKKETANIKIRITPTDAPEGQDGADWYDTEVSTDGGNTWVASNTPFQISVEAYTAGNGLALSGTEFSLKIKDTDNFTVNTDGLSANVATVTYTAASTTEGTPTSADLTVGATTGLLNKDAAVAIKNYVDAKAGEATDASKVTITESTQSGNTLKSYTFTQNGNNLGTINIPKDFLVKSATINTVTEADKEEGGKFKEDASFAVGDKYIDFVINAKEGEGEASHVYLNVKELVDAYTVESTDFITMEMSNNNITATAQTVTLENASAGDGETSAVDGLATALNVKTYIADQLAANVPNVGGQEAIVVTTAEGTTSKTVSLKLHDTEATTGEAGEVIPANVSGLKQSDAGLEINDEIEWILNCGGAPTIPTNDNQEQQ